MKKKILLFGQMLFFGTMALSQWNQTFPSPNRFGQTDWGIFPNNRVKSIGIGNFTNFLDQPRSAFHINQFYLQGSTGFPAGRLFRTDGINTVTNTWQLFTGPTAGTVTEKFSLYTLPNSNEINIQATEQDGELIFRTAGTQERFRITDTSDRIFAFGNYPPYGANLFVSVYPAKFNINDRNLRIANTEIAECSIGC